MTWVSDVSLARAATDEPSVSAREGKPTKPMLSLPSQLLGPSQAEDHRRQLDGLRFLAFLVVFVSHGWATLPSYGASGVRLFFVISGFLITRILLLHDSSSLWRDLRVFYFRRMLRIFPLYYGVLIILYIFGMLPHAAWQFFYVQNILMFLQESAIFPGHFWSLCVEEQFYLTYPVILLLTPARWRMHVLFLILCIGTAAGWLFEAWFPTNILRFWLLPTSGAFLALGCLAGLCDIRLRNCRSLGTIIFCMGILLLAYCLYCRVSEVSFPEYLLSGIAFGLIVFGLWRTSNRRLISLFSFPALAYLGKISYGLYVYHPFVLEVLTRIEAKVYIPGLWRTLPLVAFFFTVLVAGLSWHFFELPINNLKRKFPYARSRALFSL